MPWWEWLPLGIFAAFVVWVAGLVALVVWMENMGLDDVEALAVAARLGIEVEPPIVMQANGSHWEYVPDMGGWRCLD